MSDDWGQVKPYSSSRDWEKIESEINEELQKEKPEGEVPLLCSDCGHGGYM